MEDSISITMDYKFDEDSFRNAMPDESNIICIQQMPPTPSFYEKTKEIIIHFLMFVYHINGVIIMSTVMKYRKHWLIDLMTLNTSKIILRNHKWLENFVS